MFAGQRDTVVNIGIVPPDSGRLTGMKMIDKDGKERARRTFLGRHHVSWHLIYTLRIPSYNMCGVSAVIT